MATEKMNPMFLVFKWLDLFFQRFSVLFARMGFENVPGALSAYRFIRKVIDGIYNKLGPKGDVLIVTQNNKMFVNIGDKRSANAASPGLALLTSGVIEPYSTELFKGMIKEGMVVVDVGANMGYFTLIAAGLVGDNGKVYAFEPELDNFRLLCKNIELNGYKNVIPIQKAVSDKKGTARFWLSNINSGGHSLSLENVRCFAKGQGMDFAEVDSIEVETITLDDFFYCTMSNPRVDVLKVDAEGMERHIINGARKIMEGNDIKVIMEFVPCSLRGAGTDPLELLKEIEGYGFTIRFINEVNKILEPMEKIIRFCDKDTLSCGLNVLLEKNHRFIKTTSPFSGMFL